MYVEQYKLRFFLLFSTSNVLVRCLSQDTCLRIFFYLWPWHKTCFHEIKFVPAKQKFMARKLISWEKKIKVVHRKNNSWPRNKTKITKNSPWPQYKSHSHKNKIRGHKINVVSTKYISFHEFHIFMYNNNWRIFCRKIRLMFHLQCLFIQSI